MANNANKAQSMRENELDVANKSKYINGVSRTFNTRSYLNLQPRKKGCETQRKREAGVCWGERWGSTHLFTAWQLWILQNAKMSCKFARVCNMRALFIWQLQLPVTVLQALPLVTAPGFRVFSASLSLSFCWVFPNELSTRSLLAALRLRLTLQFI